MVAGETVRDTQGSAALNRKEKRDWVSERWGLRCGVCRTPDDCESCIYGGGLEVREHKQ